MKKFTFISLFNILFMLSFNASASATLTWNGQSVALGTNAVFSSSVFAGNSLSQVRMASNSDISSFSDSWFFKVHPENVVSTVSEGVDKLGNSLDGNSLNQLGFGDWYVSEGLSGSLEDNMMMVQSKTGSTYNVRKEKAEQVAITTTPIPAAFWLFGSALLGVGGLTARSKRT